MKVAESCQNVSDCSEPWLVFTFVALLVFVYNACILVKILLLIPDFNEFFHGKSLYIGTKLKAIL